MRMNGRWARQLVTIYNRGLDARKNGQPRSSNPYKEGYRNCNGPGGQLQRQRRQAWYDGWDHVNFQTTLADPAGANLTGAPSERT